GLRPESDLAERTASPPPLMGEASAAWRLCRLAKLGGGEPLAPSLPPTGSYREGSTIPPAHRLSSQRRLGSNAQLAQAVKWIPACAGMTPSVVRFQWVSLKFCNLIPPPQHPCDIAPVSCAEARS